MGIAGPNQAVCKIWLTLIWWSRIRAVVEMGNISTEVFEVKVAQI